MSKVNAYRCDFCGVVKEDKECSGISPVKDMFDPLESNKACPCENSDVHFCLDCYRVQVLNATANMTYRNASDDAKNAKTLKEMTYAFKQAVFYRLKERLRKEGKKFVS